MRSPHANAVVTFPSTHSVRRWRLGLWGAASAVAAFFLTVSAALALPADRAYELVSPPDKGDQGVLGGVTESLAPRNSPSGDDMAYLARGSFAGSPANHSAGNFYLASRTPASWSTVSLSPPLDPNPNLGQLKVLRLSEDRSKAVVRSNAALSPGAWSSSGNFTGEPLYLRDLQDDSYELLTPAPVPPGTTPYSSDFIGAAADLSQVLFETTAKLTTDAPASGRKVYKWAAGTLTPETVLPDGTAVTGSAGSTLVGPSEVLEGPMSRDGSRLFFSAIGGENNGRLFLREDGVTSLVNDPENTSQTITPGAAIFRGATPDGSKVFFTSTQALVDEDTDTSTDLYLYTHSGDPGDEDNLTLVSVDGEPDDGGVANVQGVLDFSDDGSRVYFTAEGHLVDGATPECAPPVPTCPVELMLYLWEEGEVSFIATLDGGDVNIDERDSRAYGRRYVPPSGAGVMFASRRQLTGYDNASPACAELSDGFCEQIFLYRADSSTPVSPDVVCLSCNPTGAPPTGPAGYGRADLLRRTRHLTEDGRRAFFVSPEPLVPNDTNGKRDAYMWEDGALHLISSGRSDEDSLFEEASPSGDDAFFTTTERLVGWDLDSSADLYDARVGGGLPEPPHPALPCSGDQCQGSPSGRPLLANPASSSFLGLGDLAPGARPSFSLRRLSRAQRAKLARGGRVLLPVAVTRAGRVSATARAKVAGRRRVVARSSTRSRRPGMVKVPLRLSMPARRALQRGRSLKVTLSVRFTGVREAKAVPLNLERTGKGR